MPRFVILTHDHPFLHWDFMLEHDDMLRTWRLLSQPAESTDIAAEALPDHRKSYLDYEGPISNDRGHVTRWDHGTFEIVDESDGRLRFQLKGTRLAGIAELARERDSTKWTFYLSPDETRSAV